MKAKYSGQLTAEAKNDQIHDPVKTIVVNRRQRVRAGLVMQACSNPDQCITCDEKNLTAQQLPIWVIEGPYRLERNNDREIVKRRRFLQIATGQWTSVDYATHFPYQKTALKYAREYGLMIDGQTKITCAVTKNHENSTHSKPTLAAM